LIPLTCYVSSEHKRLSGFEPNYYGNFNTNKTGIIMNKNELVEQIAKNAEITKVQAAEALDATIKAITTSLKKGNEVRLVGFGTFLTQKRKATKGRNPRTGAEIKIPASTQAKFRPGKALKEAVN